ncbi:MAG: hypothetical protein ACP5VE_10175, partial [Chthonomonadales bacterium]
HPYLYCDHDPVNAVDPGGHFWFFVLAALLLIGGAGCGYRDGSNSGDGGDHRRLPDFNPNPDEHPGVSGPPMPSPPPSPPDWPEPSEGDRGKNSHGGPKQGE